MRHLFAAFDLFPSAKGAASRTSRTVAAIAESGREVTFACLGYGNLPRVQVEGAITVRRCLAYHPNFLTRTDLYADFLRNLLTRQGRPLSTVHFRDIWSGMPILTHPHARQARILYEVNALPSVELPAHYPQLAKNPGFLAKLRQMELFCLQRADRVITVSQVGMAFLHGLGVPKDKITHLPNAADLPAEPPSRPRQGILYAGTLTPWQGVETLIDSLGWLDGEIPLTIACSTKKFLRPLRQRARKRGVLGQIDFRIGLERSRLFQRYEESQCTIAPLARGDRNELQGCCPIKMLESMARQTPVIASDLPVCREIIRHGENGLLFTPGSARALASAIQGLLDQGANDLGRMAQQTVRDHFSAGQFTARIGDLYNRLS